MPQLTERTDLWRMQGVYDGGRQMLVYRTRVPCLRVPISSFDKVAAALVARSTGSTESFRSEGRTSTDVFLLPTWVGVRTEDELRRGRRTDNTGLVVAYRYTVDGIREYEGLAYQDVVAAFCSLTQ